MYSMGMLARIALQFSKALLFTQMSFALGRPTSQCWWCQPQRNWNRRRRAPSQMGRVSFNLEGFQKDYIVN